MRTTDKILRTLILTLLGLLVLVQVAPSLLPVSSPWAIYGAVSTLRLAWFIVAGLCFVIGLHRKDAWIANAAVVAFVVTILESCFTKTFIR